MKKAKLTNSIFAVVVAMLLLLLGNGSAFAEENPSGACTKYLETVSGLSNMPCTPGNLSAILVFVPPQPPVSYPCADLLAIYSNPPDANCTPQVNSAIVPLK